MRKAMSTIDPSNVPMELHAAIPLAEKWGIPEEPERISLAEQASDAELLAFLSVMHRLNLEVLFAWLPEIIAEPISEEQIAFMNLALAVDAVEMELENRGIVFPPNG